MAQMHVKHKRRIFGCATGLFIIIFTTLFYLGVLARQKAKAASALVSPTIKEPLLLVVAPTNVVVKRYFTSRLQADLTIPIMAQVSEIIEEIPVDVGSIVTQGQMLVKFDDRYKKISLQEAQAGNLEAQIVSSNAFLNLENHRALYASGVVGDSTRRQYFVEYYNSLAGTQKAEAKLNFAQEQLSDCTLRASHDGVISDKKIDIGKRTSINEMLLDLAVDTTLEFYMDIEDRDIPLIKYDMPAYFTADAYEGECFTSKVFRIGVDVKSDSQLYKIKAKFDNNQRRLRAGMMIRVELSIKEYHKEIFVPAYTVSRIGENNYIMLYRNGVTELMEVETGEYCNDIIQIKDGLKAGDKILLK